jgi:hypothetical protein
LLRDCYQAGKQTLPDALDGAGQAALAALHGITMGYGGLSCSQGSYPGQSTRMTAVV